MHLDNQILATKKQFTDFMSKYPSGQPVTMLNILKFRTRSGKGDESGEKAYNRYSKNMVPLLKKAGGKLIWAGKVNITLIGDEGIPPDRILVVRYPSKEAFIEMTTSEAYKKVGHDREIALQYGGLLACQDLT